MTPLYLLFNGKFVRWYFSEEQAKRELERAPDLYVLKELVLVLLPDEFGLPLLKLPMKADLPWTAPIELDQAWVKEVMAIRKKWLPHKRRKFLIFHREGLCRWGGGTLLDVFEFEPERFLGTRGVTLTPEQDARLHVFNEQLIAVQPPL